MVLNNVRVVNENNAVNIRIENGRISEISKKAVYSSEDESQLFFNNVIAFPGLINSHDHLDFNLFPQIGNNIYKNYAEWGRYIHRNHKEAINEVLQIPGKLRTQWGIYKNLLCGITTVVNHGDFLDIENPLLTVFQQCQSLHSTGFEKWWKLKLNDPFKKKYPCVIHTGEGTDKFSEDKIDKLIKWNFLKRDLIGIHGVMMKKDQASHFKGLVWCPESNYFLLDKTASIDKLKHNTRIVFGTDSTLTASWNLWDQLRLVRDKKIVSESELFDMLTVSPSSLWNFPRLGRIAEDYQADIVIAESTGKGDFKDFYELNPHDILLILHKGEIRLFDELLYQQLNANYILIDFHKIYIEGRCKYVQGDLPGLMNNIKKYYKEVCFPVIDSD